MKKATLHLLLVLFISNIMQAQPCPSITGFSVTPPSCFGMSDGKIEINYTSGTPTYSVFWSSSLPVTMSSALSQSVSGVAAGSYNVILSDNNGCVVMQPVNVSQPSSLLLMTTPNITICYGQSTSIAAFGSGGTPSYTYSWTPSFIGGGPHSVSPTVTTTYSVSINDSKGCSVNPKVITVSVTPSLSISGSVYTICDGDAMIISPNILSAGNGGPYSYLWSPTNETTSSITVVGNAPSGVTTNTFAVSVDDGCTAPNSVAVFTINASVCAGINDLQNENLVNVFPNPFNHILSFSGNKEIKQIEITNYLGQVEFSEIVNNKDHQLQLQKLTQGIYFIKVIFNNGPTVTRKIIKQ